MDRAAFPSHALTDHRVQDQHLRVQSQTPVHATPPMSHGITQTGARTLQEIEAEMRLAAQQARQRQELESQQQLQLQREHEIRLMEQEQQQERHHLQQLQQQQHRLGQHQHQLQSTPPPRMVHHAHTQLPRTQSPRFQHQHQHQHQILLLQQEQERQQQERLKELQERLRTEEIERQLRAQQISQIQRQPSVQARRQASYADLQMLQQRRTHSPAYLGVGSGESLINQQNAQLLPQSIQLQQRLLSEMAQAEFMRDMQGISQIEQDTLRAEAMRKIMETERMEEKRRRKALKIAHMVGTIHPYCSASANYAITVTLQ